MYGKTGPNHSVRLSPILPEIEVNQVKRMVGRGYWAEVRPRTEHRTGREQEGRRSEWRTGELDMWVQGVWEVRPGVGQGVDSHIRLQPCPGGNHLRWMRSDLSFEKISLDVG